MTEIKKLVVGETTETVIRTLFDQRISQESSSNDLNSLDRALKIKNLKTQIIGFVKRNHNGIFELIVPEYKIDKVVKLHFTNFEDPNVEEGNDFSHYKIVVNDNFVTADIIQKVCVGKDIVLKIKAE